MTENQMMSLIIDRLDRIENKLDKIPQCNYAHVKEELNKGRDRFNKIESDFKAYVKKEEVSLVYKTLAFACTIVGVVIGWFGFKIGG